MTVSVPVFLSDHLVAFPTHPINQYNMLVNSKITQRNMKITSMVTNELYLQVLLKWSFSLFIITCYLFPLTLCHFGQTALKTLNDAPWLGEVGIDLGSTLKTT